LLVCGYIDDFSKISKDDRPKLPNRAVRDEKVSEWISKVQKLTAALNRTDFDALGPLHEINRWAGQVNAIAHRMLVKDRELDFSANFEAASRDMKSLFKASEMLVDAFDYLNIFYNPSSAAFGKTRSVDLYKLVDKIRIILMGAEGASQNKKIYISGSLRTTLDLYESFKIIPFCFLQNAIKYSFDSDIVITFSSNSREIEMSVESSGPQIRDDEKEKIFERGYRGEWSKKIHHEGLGVGLYIAKIVADAHSLEIKVRSVPKNYQREGIPVCTNTFSIKFPIGGGAERRLVTRS
jgi:anti-sigma regulatory factor (Ser/Thr protein kinase)